MKQKTQLYFIGLLLVIPSQGISIRTREFFSWVWYWYECKDECFKMVKNTYLGVSDINDNNNNRIMLILLIMPCRQAIRGMA